VEHPFPKLFTVEEANALLPTLQEILQDIFRHRDALREKAPHMEPILNVAPTNGGGPPGRVVSEAFLALRSAVGELEEMDIVLRDIDRGLIDFPAIRDGREVYLCWEEGEDRVEHWHDIDAGFGGRQEL